MFNFFVKQKIQDKDEAVIAQLVKHGSDLFKPHSIDFFLYFSEQGIAEQARELIQQRFTDASVVIKNSQKNFLCEVKISMVPNLDTLQNIRAQFEAITATIGGEYDGWGTAIE